MFLLKFGEFLVIYILVCYIFLRGDSMKKLLILFLLTICLFSGCVLEPETLVTSRQSPDGNFTVSLYQVGSPQWSFGPVKAKLVLADSWGKILDEENFSLNNDGTDVFAGNIAEIIWSDSYVEVEMWEADTTKSYQYVLNYSK